MPQQSPRIDNQKLSWVQRKVVPRLVYVRPALLGSFLKKALCLKRQEIHTSEGIFFIDLASNLGSPLITAGEYEPHMVDVIKSSLRPGNVFVDLGANEGFFSVIASKLVGRDGKVLAVEPQTRLQPIINRNLSLNGCENVTVLPFAINADSKPLTLNISPDMNTGSTSGTRTTRYPLPQEEVGGITLAEIFRRHSLETCDLLKVDIEGYEYEAIMGSPELFTSGQIKAIALELHPGHLAKRNLSGEDIVQFLTSCGYRRDLSFPNIVFINDGRRGVTASQA